MGQLLLKNDLFVLEPCFLGDISISFVGSTEVKPSFFFYVFSLFQFLVETVETNILTSLVGQNMVCQILVC